MAAPDLPSLNFDEVRDRSVAYFPVRHQRTCHFSNLVFSVCDRSVSTIIRWRVRLTCFLLKEKRGVDRASRGEARESIAIEIRLTLGSLCEDQRGVWLIGGGGINGTGAYGKGSNDFGLF